MFPFDKNIRVEGPRLYLRPITEDDTDMILSWRNSERVVSYFLYRKPISRAEHLDWLHNKVYKGLVHQFVICEKETDKPVGCAYMQHFNEEKLEAEVGMFMATDLPTGTGYGTEGYGLLKKYGIEILGLKRLFAEVLAKNIASIRMNEKNDYVFESLKKDFPVSDGSFEDLRVYAYNVSEEK